MLEEIHMSEGPYPEAFYTKEDKKIVINDWEEAMKPMKRRKGLSWYNRVGPLVVCFGLNMNAYSRRYSSEYSVHNLCREFECLTATLRIYKGGISPDKHNKLYIEDARAIREKAYIPIEGDLDIDQIIAGYERFFEERCRSGGELIEFEDFVWVCGWTKKAEKIEYALNVAYNRLKANDWWFRCLSSENGQYVEGRFDEWFRKLEESAWDGDKLNAIYESELIKHKLEKIPERKILF